MRNWVTLTFGILTSVFLIFSVSALVLLRSQQDNLRQQSYDVTGMGALQLRLHYEMLMGALASWEGKVADSNTQQVVLAFDILYERIQSLPTRPAYDRILNEDLLAIQASLLNALTKEIPNIDQAADGHEAGLAGLRTRLLPLRPDFEQLGHRPVQIASQSRAQVTQEYERINNWFWVVISGFILSGLFFMAIIMRQLMKMQTMTEGLRNARDAAEAASNAKSDFLAHMSHELRTPMNAILGFTQLLEMRSLDDHQAMAVKHILQSGRLLLSLIDQVLELNQIVIGKATVTPVEVAPLELLKSSVSLVESKAQETQIILHEAVAQGRVPNIVTDPLRTQQILLNLLSNAIKYNRPGGEVFASCAPLGHDRVVFTVRDTGKGIAPERQSEVFEPFNRLGYEASAIEGTGIGLTITRELLLRLNGSIRFTSTPDKGTTFWVDFPIAWTDAPIDEAAAAKTLTTGD